MRYQFCVPVLRRLTLVALSALALASCGGPPAPVPHMPPKSQFSGTYPSDFQIHGIDVARYQGDIDWHAVKASGVAFAWIKATEGGDHLDPNFMRNWQGARAAGVPRGAYHFVHWCRPPHEEMSWYKRNVPVEPDALPPVLDVEAQPTSKSCRRKLHRPEVLAEMREMLIDMERHYGKRPVIYVTVDFYEHIMHPNEFADYPIWVRSTKHSPHVPYPGRRWAFWQYQSDGRVPGIKGNVDRNAFYGTASQWRAFLQGLH